MVVAAGPVSCHGGLRIVDIRRCRRGALLLPCSKSIVDIDHDDDIIMAMLIMLVMAMWWW